MLVKKQNVWKCSKSSEMFGNPRKKSEMFGNAHKKGEMSGKVVKKKSEMICRRS